MPAGDSSLTMPLFKSGTLRKWQGMKSERYGPGNEGEPDVHPGCESAAVPALAGVNAAPGMPAGIHIEVLSMLLSVRGSGWASPAFKVRT